MTIDFRVAVDWIDNGHVNWLQDASSENDPLSALNTAEVGSWTVTNGTITADVSNYGLDYAEPTTPPTEMFIARNGSGLGEITVSVATPHTVVVWARKNNAADNAKNLRLEVYETGLGSIQASYGNDFAVFDAGQYVRGSVTFTTTLNTDRVFVRTISSDGGWTGTYIITGLMVYAGSTVASTFNDGFIKVLTHRVADARWNVGYKTSIVSGSVANENRLECMVYNLDDYIDEAKYGDVHRVYIEGSDDSGSTWTRLYTGWTRVWYPIFDTVNPAQHLKFTAVSSRYYMDGINARLAVQESKTMKQIAQAILDVVELPDGDTLTLGGSSGSTFSYAGHTWTEDVDLLRALADTVGGDGYIFWFDRSDTPNTLAISNLTDTALLPVDFSISNYMRGSADYRYADPWFNMVEMKVSPRKLSSTSDKLLWSLPEDYPLTAGQVYTILARFNDEDKPYQIGARNLSHQNFTGTPGTSNVTVTITPKSTSAYIELDATARVSDTTINTFELIGQKIKSWDSYFEQRYFSSEVTTNGNNTKTLHYDITDDIDTAESIIGDWLDIFGEKEHRLWSLIVLGGQDDSNCVDYTIGDECVVSYPNGTSYKHTVIGEEWRWRKDSSYEKRWYLEKHGNAVAAPTRPT